MAISNVGSSVSQDVNGIPQAAKDAERRVTSDLSGGEIKSEVSSPGSQKIFQNGAKQLGKQDFLQLLVTQMRYQDPMEPQDNQQFIAQLAQFSSLEGTQNINASIEDLSKKIEGMVSRQSESSTSISNASATNLIGKPVRVTAKDVVFDPTKNKPIEINVHVNAGEEAVLSIVDSQGTIVNALPLPKPGESMVDWNGQKMDGSKAPAGKYELKVTSKDGSRDTGYAYFEDKVSGISYSKTGMLLEVRGQSIGLDQVVHVGDAGE